jgi:hypothetical protein
MRSPPVTVARGVLSTCSPRCARPRREDFAEIELISSDPRFRRAVFQNDPANRAIAELALLVATEGAARDRRQEAWQAALRLRYLLKFEFFSRRRRRVATIAELAGDTREAAG